jgi:hypothetical protein
MDMKTPKQCEFDDPLNYIAGTGNYHSNADPAQWQNQNEKHHWLYQTEAGQAG